MIAVFVTNGTFFPRQKEWISAIKEKFPEVIGLLQNINASQTNVILGQKWRGVFGNDFLTERLRGLGAGNEDLQLKVSVQSFFQVNTPMARELYNTVKSMAIDKKPALRTTLLDLYCGVGGIALSCADYFGQIIGVDEAESSIRDARQNAPLNRTRNTHFHCESAERFMDELPTDGEDYVVVLDPPRAGCDARILQKILRLSPRKIVYVSCDPSTLARDLKILCALNNPTRYAISKIQPIDMFAQSAHLETVALLEKKV